MLICSLHNDNPLRSWIAKHLDKALHEHKPSQSTSIFRLLRGAHSHRVAMRESFSRHLFAQFIFSRPSSSGWLLSIVIIEHCGIFVRALFLSLNPVRSCIAEMIGEEKDSIRTQLKGLTLWTLELLLFEPRPYDLSSFRLSLMHDVSAILGPVLSFSLSFSSLHTLIYSGALVHIQKYSSAPFLKLYVFISVHVWSFSSLLS